MGVFTDDERLVCRRCTLVDSLADVVKNGGEEEAEEVLELQAA
jgi:hypothetical protein